MRLPFVQTAQIHFIAMLSLRMADGWMQDLGVGSQMVRERAFIAFCCH